MAWSAILSITITALGFRMRDSIRAFGVLYLLSVGIFALGQWADAAVSDNLEPPVVARVVGLAIANTTGSPHWLDAGFRAEFSAFVFAAHWTALGR